MPSILTHDNQFPKHPQIIKELYKDTNKYRTIKLKEYLFHMASGDSFIALVGYLKNRITARDLEKSDKSIYYVKEFPNQDRNQTDIEIKFSKNILKIFNVSEDDIYFYKRIMSPYESYYFHDYSEGISDLKDGYGFFNYLNKENIKLLANISSKIYSKEFDIHNEKFLIGFSKILLNLFSHEIYEINENYIDERNNEMNSVAKDSINAELNEFIKNFKFKLTETDKITIKAKDLLSLYIKYNLPHLDVENLFKTIFEDDEPQIGGWTDDMYNFTDSDYFDDESFNRNANVHLNTILEIIEDDKSGYFDMIEKVVSKFRLNTWYALPKNKNYSFQIVGFNKENLKIELKIKKSFYPIAGERIVILSEQNFYYLLYQPELFNFDELYNF